MPEIESEKAILRSMEDKRLGSLSNLNPRFSGV